MVLAEIRKLEIVRLIDRSGAYVLTLNILVDVLTALVANQRRQVNVDAEVQLRAQRV
jgi:hypothetical protein